MPDADDEIDKARRRRIQRKFKVLEFLIIAGGAGTVGVFLFVLWMVSSFLFFVAIATLAVFGVLYWWMGNDA